MFNYKKVGQNCANFEIIWLCQVILIKMAFSTFVNAQINDKIKIIYEKAI